MAKMKIYKWCNCRVCKRQTNGTQWKKYYKNEAHRKFRRLSKQALRYEDDSPIIVSTGYRD